MPKNNRKPSHKPYINEFEDALGVYGGKTCHAHAWESMEKAAVQAVDCIGNRPIDWMKRQLLAGAAGDDRRNWMYRALLKNDPSFLVQSYDQPLSRAKKAPRFEKHGSSII